MGRSVYFKMKMRKNLIIRLLPFYFSIVVNVCRYLGKPVSIQFLTYINSKQLYYKIYNFTSKKIAVVNSMACKLYLCIVKEREFVQFFFLSFIVVFLLIFILLTYFINTLIIFDIKSLPLLLLFFNRST